MYMSWYIMRGRKFRLSLTGSSCMCLFDISAAFDTIDHTILLKRLFAWFGFTDTALLWIQSYLFSRSFSVKTSEASSKSDPLTCGVPQGSVLGTLMFILYTTPLSSLIKASSVDHHLRGWHRIIHLLLSKQLLRIHRLSSSCGDPSLERRTIAHRQ